MKNIDASEIARLAGVSRATVSRVVNNYEYVSTATRKRVLKAIEDYHYTPNFSAQILAGSRSNTIGLFIVYGGDSKHSRLEDTHINFMMERIIHTAVQHGFYVLVYLVQDLSDALERKRIMDMFVQSRIDAGIFIGFPNHSPIIDELIDRDYIVGVFDRHHEEREAPNTIITRLNYGNISVMVDYAVRLGHRDIMIVTSDMVAIAGVDVFRVFEQEMRRCGLTCKPEFNVLTEKLTRTHSQEAFTAFMKKNAAMPSFVLCVNDLVAFGVIDVLKQWGYSVPDDISVMGSDDALVSSYFDPPLTTMRYDFDGMMELLTTKVIECIKEPFQNHFCVNYSPDLVVRKSCARFTGTDV